MPQLRDKIEATLAEQGTPVLIGDLVTKLVEKGIYTDAGRARRYVVWLIRTGKLKALTSDSTPTKSVARSCRVTLAEPYTLREPPHVCACSDAKVAKANCSKANEEMTAILTWLAEREKTRKVIAEELIPERDRLKAALVVVEQKIEALHQKLRNRDDVTAEAALRHVISSQRSVLESAGVL